MNSLMKYSDGMLTHWKKEKKKGGEKREEKKDKGLFLINNCYSKCCGQG